LHRVRNVGEDLPGPAGTECARLAADREGHRAREQDADLLRLVAVLGNDRAGIELDQPERHAHAVYRTGNDPRPDLPGGEVGDVRDGAQASFPATSCPTPEPSARPAPCGITSAMTRPMSRRLVAPFSAIASSTIRSSSSSESGSGMNSSST